MPKHAYITRLAHLRVPLPELSRVPRSLTTSPSPRAHPRAHFMLPPCPPGPLLATYTTPSTLLRLPTARSLTRPLPLQPKTPGAGSPDAARVPASATPPPSRWAPAGVCRATPPHPLRQDTHRRTTHWTPIGPDASQPGPWPSQPLASSRAVRRSATRWLPIPHGRGSGACAARSLIPSALLCRGAHEGSWPWHAARPPAPFSMPRRWAMEKESSATRSTPAHSLGQLPKAGAQTTLSSIQPPPDAPAPTPAPTSPATSTPAPSAWHQQVLRLQRGCRWVGPLDPMVEEVLQEILAIDDELSAANLWPRSPVPATGGCLSEGGGNMRDPGLGSGGGSPSMGSPGFESERRRQEGWSGAIPPEGENETGEAHEQGVSMQGREQGRRAEEQAGQGAAYPQRRQRGGSGIPVGALAHFPADTDTDTAWGQSSAAGSSLRDVGSARERGSQRDVDARGGEATDEAYASSEDDFWEGPVAAELQRRFTQRYLDPACRGEYLHRSFAARQVATKLLLNLPRVCQNCWLLPLDCICSQLKTVQLPRNIVLWVYLHPKELLHRNNTGKLLWQVLGPTNVRLCVSGIASHEDAMWEEVLASGVDSAWCLYPSRAAQPHTAATLPLPPPPSPQVCHRHSAGQGQSPGSSTLQPPSRFELPIPMSGDEGIPTPMPCLHFIIVDGTWNTSRAMVTRLQEQLKGRRPGAELGFVVLSKPSPSVMHNIRIQPSKEKVCTAAAASRLLAELGEREDLLQWSHGGQVALGGGDAAQLHVNSGMPGQLHVVRRDGVTGMVQGHPGPCQGGRESLTEAAEAVDSALEALLGSLARRRMRSGLSAVRLGVGKNKGFLQDRKRRWRGKGAWQT